MPDPADTASYPSLSADQQRLLRAALTSNRTINMEEFRNSALEDSDRIFKGTMMRSQSVSQGIDPHVFDAPSTVDLPASASHVPTFGDSFLPDFSNGETTDFDVDLPEGVLSGLSGFGSSDVGAEKRKSPEDDDDEESEDMKRREADDKTPKKPGRKPLTAEPTTKRKAQNRAAQRAFRERKEKHLKDLEQRISDLQKVSQHANHENSLLRAQVLSLQTELQTYRKRLTFNSGLSNSPKTATFSAYQNVTGTASNPFDFSFIAPHSAGQLSSLVDSSHDLPQDSSVIKQEPSSRSNSTVSPPLFSNVSQRHQPQSSGQSQPSHSAATASSIFTPGFFNLGSSGYGFPQYSSPQQFSAHNGDPAFGRRIYSSRSASTTSHAPSPSMSSVSQIEPSSSCGTSPEPSHDSPVRQNEGKADSMKSPFGDLSDFQFDPAIFGNYRETQDAIYGDGDFTGGLYDDFLNMPDDYFNTNFTQKDDSALSPSERKPEARASWEKEAGPDDDLRPPSDPDKKKMMTCHKIWQQLQTCPKYQQGELDIDGLCSELSKKATCSESGATIPKDDWEAALWRMVGEGSDESDQKNSPGSVNNV